VARRNGLRFEMGNAGLEAQQLLAQRDDSVDMFSGIHEKTLSQQAARR
jgi:hypothetical protein